jgi:hypothetical protein
MIRALCFIAADRACFTHQGVTPASCFRGPSDRAGPGARDIAFLESIRPCLQASCKHRYPRSPERRADDWGEVGIDGRRRAVETLSQLSTREGLDLSEVAC